MSIMLSVEEAVRYRVCCACRRGIKAKELCVHASGYRDTGNICFPCIFKQTRGTMKVVIEVLGGVAYLKDAPEGLAVEIIDYDDNT